MGKCRRSRSGDSNTFAFCYEHQLPTLWEHRKLSIVLNARELKPAKQPGQAGSFAPNGFHGTRSRMVELSESSSASEKTVHLMLVTNSASVLMSTPTASRPAAIASTSVVPPPTCGSSTRSPGCVKVWIAADAKTGENRAGYL